MPVPSISIEDAFIMLASLGRKDKPDAVDAALTAMSLSEGERLTVLHRLQSSLDKKLIVLSGVFSLSDQGKMALHDLRAKMASLDTSLVLIGIR